MNSALEDVSGRLTDSFFEFENGLNSTNVSEQTKYSLQIQQEEFIAMYAKVTPAYIEFIIGSEPIAKADFSNVKRRTSYATKLTYMHVAHLKSVS